MDCSALPIIEPCTHCKHPLEYLFENAYLATKGQVTRSSLSEVIDRILDFGLFVPACNVCCSNCDQVYVLSSVERFAMFSEDIITPSSATCCLNIYSSVNTYNDTIGFFPLKNCCNTKFNDCINDLLCWMNKPTGNLSRFAVGLLSKGILEYGSFYNNCTEDFTSGICFIVDFLKKIPNFYEMRYELLDRILDKGIVVYCDGERVLISSVETYVNYIND